jgi:hypothetical protein
MPFTTAFDLVAEVGEEAQGIALVVGHARNETRDQDLAREHASVQFFHRWLLPFIEKIARRYERACRRLQPAHAVLQAHPAHSAIARQQVNDRSAIPPSDATGSQTFPIV